MSDAARDTTRTYDRISAAYDLIAEPAEHGPRDRGVALLDAHAGERVLEIGSGTGRVLFDLGPTVGDDGLVCGLDASAGMLARARSRAAGDHVLLQRGDARSLPYLSQTFDAVFMSFTLELFEAAGMERVLAEVTRVLKAGGRLAVVSLNRPAEPSLAVSAYDWGHRRFPHWIDCRPIDVGGVLAAAGYRVTRSEGLSVWGLPVIAALGYPVGGLSAGCSPRG